MEHVVFYQSTQGSPAFRRVASLEDAVSFAEHLRNVDGVTDFSVYALSPVTLSLRAYYHVEVAGAADGQATAGGPATEDEPTPPPLPEQAASAEAPAATERPSDAPDSGYVAGRPFAAAPPVPQSASADEAPLAETASDSGPITEPAPVDPNVVDPTVEEVVPSGRRSMGFFARP